MTSLLVAVLLAQTAGWINFATADNKGSVTAPCTMTKDSSAKPTDNLFSCSTAARDEFYFIIWSDYGADQKIDVSREMVANRDATLKSITANVTLLTSGERTYQGFPALEFTANAQGKFLIVSRVVVQNRRLYQLSTLTPLDQDRSASIQRFFDSLKFN